MILVGSLILFMVGVVVLGSWGLKKEDETADLYWHEFPG